MTTHQPAWRRPLFNSALVGLLDATGMVGALGVGMTLGHLAYDRAPDRYGHSGHLAAGIAAGLLSAITTEALASAVTEPWQRALITVPRTSETAGPPVDETDLRQHIAASAASNAASRAATGWSWGAYGDPNPHMDRERWCGFEDGTAVLYLRPGTYLRFQPDHIRVGTPRSATWHGEYTLETGDALKTGDADEDTHTTVVTDPAHLLALLFPEPEPATSQEAGAPTDDATQLEPHRPLHAADGEADEHTGTRSDTSAAPVPAT
ncbi:hypothetical protein [Streptomyces sp. N35]|uniref:hypothetical protein n=1 Tax=Streptomyces sp. N35 TaxID=2795730 RepID=UPI0018F676BB|nr:hypothetical protein [Streptomyces sp. N35]